MQSTDPEILKICGDLTLELIKIRQSDCKHLRVENLAPEIFEKLIAVVRIYKMGSDEHLAERAAALGLYDLIRMPASQQIPICRVCGVSHASIGGECPFMWQQANKQC